MADSMTVLLVDDKEMTLEVCKQMLEVGGYHVLTASSPSEAMAIAENYKGDIDLLLTDVMMPGMNGVELSKKLSSLRKTMRTLFMSGFTSDIINQECGHFDQIKLLRKPFSMNELLRRVSSTLNKSYFKEEPGRKYDTGTVLE
jgi:two-component system, cell cycle sensor histidine kinase and response regulator CckA